MHLHTKAKEKNNNRVEGKSLKILLPEKHLRILAKYCFCNSFLFGQFMTEQALLDYFQNRLSAEELANDLKGSQKKTSYDTTTVYITVIDNEQKFTVTREHLIKLCTDTLNGQLAPEDLNTIAFAVISSDFFSLDNVGESTEIVETVIYEWDNPETGFGLSIKNIEFWKAYLQTGAF